MGRLDVIALNAKLARCWLRRQRFERVLRRQIVHSVDLDDNWIWTILPTMKGTQGRVGLLSNVA